LAATLVMLLVITSTGGALTPAWLDRSSPFPKRVWG
jgi:hypothetical protein